MENALTIDALANEIRRVDGDHSLGAGMLAEMLMPFIRAALTPPETSVTELTTEQGVTFSKYAPLGESVSDDPELLITREFGHYGEPMFRCNGCGTSMPFSVYEAYLIWPACCGSRMSLIRNVREVGRPDRGSVGAAYYIPDSDQPPADDIIRDGDIHYAKDFLA